MTDLPAGWEPLVPADVRDEQRIRDARQARLDQHVRVRVRCTDGQLHTIELRAGRLALLDHAARSGRGCTLARLSYGTATSAGSPCTLLRG
jgi:hypothetical protein